MRRHRRVTAGARPGPRLGTVVTRRLPSRHDSVTGVRSVYRSFSVCGQSTLGGTMRTRATAAMAALLLAALTACGGGGGDDTAAKPKPAASKSDTVDCSDESLDQADWMEHCADEAGTGGDGTEGQATGLEFGESYTWPDGLKVTVVEAKAWTTFTDDDFSDDDPDGTEFRILLKLTNEGKTPVELDEVSTFIDGATNGGEAATTEFATDSDPLGGRLAPGVTVTKTDDNVLETRYGRKIVVTVQRSNEAEVLEFPEFTGEITD